MNILGVWDGHDAGAALLVDGQLVAAVNEERLSRRKLEVHFPERSIRECLDIAGLRADSVAFVAASTADVAKTLGRLVPSTKESYYQVRRRKARPGLASRATRFAKYAITEWPADPVSTAVSRWWLRRTLRRLGFRPSAIRLYDHHDCHAAAAFASPFPSATVVTLDGVGDGAAATVSHFRDGRLQRLATTPARCSPGIFFEQVTSLLNMRELEDEGKVMALADYAAPVDDRHNPMLALIEADGLRIRTSRRARRLRSELADILWHVPSEQFAHMAQRALERACVDLVANAVSVTGDGLVVLAGGIASNVKVNRMVRHLPSVVDTYVFPHMGDGGLAVGAAILAGVECADPRPALPTLALGSGFSDAACAQALVARGLAYTQCDSIGGAVAELLANDRVVLWMQGRMEFGPRALGQRSVLARPDRPELRDRLNRLLKRRVWYQPFCPSLLDSEARRLLSDMSDRPNREMTMAYMVAPQHRVALAGVINVDGSCRPQMVADDAVGPYADVLRAMKARIGVGAVLNTSLNLHGLPLARSPEDVLDVFVSSGADAVALGPFLAVAAHVPGGAM